MNRKDCGGTKTDVRRIDFAVEQVKEKTVVN